MIWLANNHWTENRIANEKEKEMKTDYSQRHERKRRTKRRGKIYRHVTSTMQKQQDEEKTSIPFLSMAVFVFDECQYLMLIYYRYCFVKTRTHVCVCVRARVRIVLNQNREMTSFWTEHVNIVSPIVRYLNNFRFWHTKQRWAYELIRT